MKKVSIFLFFVAMIASSNACYGNNSGPKKYVDLGLPSGTLWATCNIGANSPEEYGDYFAWGEIVPKRNANGDYSEYSWNTYAYDYSPTTYWSTENNKMTKYCTNSDYGSVDNKIKLEFSDDAATANWGSNWRMPTEEEVKELLTECTLTKTTLKGVSGYEIKGPNGNSIFLPGAGYRIKTYLENGWSCFWSSSLDKEYSKKAYYCMLFEDGTYSLKSTDRYLGKTVRPIFSPTTNPLKGYEWLEGTWVAQKDGFWGKVVVGKSTYKVVSSNWNNDISEIDKVEAKPISIARIYASIFDKNMIALDATDYCIGIEPSTKQVYLNLGEYTTLYLNKVTSDSHLKRHYSIDVRQMDFSIKFNVVRFKKDANFRKDYWFSEVGELVTDNKWWTSGRYKSNGYYTYHRFNSTQYTCTFLDQGYVKGEDGYGGNVNYGVALRDVPRSTLPEENGYYVLDLRNWEGYVPLYFPYSNEYILENFNMGDIIFEYYE